MHEFLFYYVYNDSIRFSKGSLGSGMSKLLVFFLSAVVHEVIVMCTFGFFYPILLIMFGGPGVIFMLTMKSNSRMLGISFWFFLIIGNGMLITFYGLEYYTRQMPEVKARIEREGIQMFFIPQSFSYLSSRYG